MTRKRYVKLLMAQGYSRNSANYFADRALVYGRTYRKDYDIMLVGIRAAEGFREVMEAIKRALAKTAESFAAATNVILEAGRAFNNAYLAAMDKKKEPEA